MKRAAVFGIGRRFFEHESELENSYDIVCLVDNDKEKQGTFYNGRKILNITEMLAEDFEVILVVPNSHKMEIIYDLLGKGISKDKIVPWIYNGGRIWKEFELLLEEDGCYAKFDEIRFVCRTSSDFYILDEIYLNNSYGFFVGNIPLVAIDIGMNVGLASLFLAHQGSIEKIYSFEPFPETYERALENIRMNDDFICEKIVTHNYGLGKGEKEYYVQYKSDCCGGANTLFASNKWSEGSVLVKIRDAGREIRKILDMHVNKRIIMKVDTEGAEYDIFYSMIEQDILQKVYILLIETHCSRESELKSILKAKGFLFFDHLHSYDCGMIYAVNMNISNV